MSIEITKPGLLSTVVASRRIGFRFLGIGPCGAMDHFALTVSNYLVGNSEGEAAVEMNFPAPEFLFQEDHLIGVTGKGFKVNVNNEIYFPWKPLWIKKGSTLKFVKIETGSRAYLSVHGGWKADEWLGSFTTHLGVKSGGHRGKALQKGDILEVNETEYRVDKNMALSFGISKNEIDKIYSLPNVIRIIESAETSLLSPESIEKLLSSSFRITNQSNRMGFRLEGEKLFLNQPLELVSSPVDFGTIQLLPDGNLIILMADHQTTGGYPRIASVIKPDLPKLAQMSPNDKVNFSLISLGDAEHELQIRSKLLEELKQSCLNHYSNDYKL